MQDFPRRGLIVDRKEGIVLKMNRHRYVGRAYFGRQQLSRSQRFKQYRANPINPRDYLDFRFELV